MIGEPVNRVDGRLKVTGAARYAAEQSIDRLAYAVIVQSSIAKGTIERIDTSASTALPGVIAVLTPDNAPRLPEGGKAAARPPARQVGAARRCAPNRYERRLGETSARCAPGASRQGQAKHPIAHR